MKKMFGLSLGIAVMLGMAAPPASWSVGAGGGAGGHLGGLGGGAGHPGSAVGVERLDPAGPLHHIDPIDREGLFEHGGLHDRPRGFADHHGRARFGYPVCFAYPYCPAPSSPCFWEDGHWAGQPDNYDERAPVVYGAWVPPGCY